MWGDGEWDRVWLRGRKKQRKKDKKLVRTATGKKLNHNYHYQQTVGKLLLKMFSQCGLYRVTQMMPAVRQLDSRKRNG